MRAIETRELTRSYGSRRGIVDLTFEVREGEVFGFLGPNGAGKTTTIRCLLGFIKPSAGSATIFGQDVWADAPKVHANVAYLGSDPAYLGDVTAATTLDYLCQLRRLPRGAWRQLAERLELDASVPVRKLSRGNRQKVGVVQVFMGAEPLLVMDEPTSGLDPLMQREFLALVAEARRAGRTIFLSSHNLTEVERACDRVAVIRDGRLAQVRTIRELLGDHWRSINLVVASPPPPGAFDLPNVRLLASSGLDVHLMVRGDVRPVLRRIVDLDLADVSVTPPDIEDVFLGVYGSATDGQRLDTAVEALAGPEKEVVR